jgi:hypothetical protein
MQGNVGKLVSNERHGGEVTKCAAHNNTGNTFDSETAAQ